MRMKTAFPFFLLYTKRTIYTNNIKLVLIKTNKSDKVQRRRTIKMHFKKAFITQRIKINFLNSN